MKTVFLLSARRLILQFNKMVMLMIIGMIKRYNILLIPLQKELDFIIGCFNEIATNRRYL